MHKATDVRDVALALNRHADTLDQYPDLQTWAGFLRLQATALLELSKREAALEQYAAMTSMLFKLADRPAAP